MARKRRRSYGFISLKSRRSKVERAYWNAEGRPGGQKVKKLHVKVFIQRGRRPTNTHGGGGYYAWACTAKPPRSGERHSNTSALANHRRAACGPDAYGKTPTAAVKAALVALGRKRDLR